MRPHLLSIFGVLALSLIGSACGASSEKALRWEQILKNDARQIGASASQFFLEHREAKSVTFGVDADGRITGPLHEWVSKLDKSVRVINGRIDGRNGTFTLQQEFAFDGKPVTFDCTGKILQPVSK